MKSHNNRYPQGIRAALAATALALPMTLNAALVGQWTGTGYVDGASTWTSTPATGNIVATVNESGAAMRMTSEVAAGTAAIDFNGSTYFTVPQANNPLNGATQASLVAIFKPLSAGATGVNFHEGSGLLGMEIVGVVNDWGFGWNGLRVSGGFPGSGVIERAAFSDPLYATSFKVAMITWDGNGTQKMYVNGQLVRTQLTGVTSPRDAAAFALGAMTSGGARPFNGQIAELRMYNSDESANAATIATELGNTYAQSFLLEESIITPTGGKFTLVDTAGGQVNAAGTFTLLFDGNPVPGTDIQVSKTGTRTTVTFTAPVTHNMSHGWDLTVPKTGGGTEIFLGDQLSHLLPTTLPGTAGTVGTWSISEYLTGAAPLPANAGNLASAVTTVLTPGTNPTTQGTAPVFNHTDPDSNNEGTTGNFNNDFPILSDVAGTQQDWIVIGKTQVNIATAGEVHTFSVRSDDGFAMRVTGPGGGRFIGTGGDGVIDPGDYQTIVRDAGTGDSNTRGTYRFDAAGTYEITYLGWDGGSGGYHEVAWAPGSFFEDRDTNAWRLVGTTTSLPPLRERWAANPPGPAAEAGGFGVRTYLASGASDLGNMTTFLNTTTRTPLTDGNTIDAQLPFLNHRDPQNGSVYRFVDDQPFPGNQNGVDENNVVTVAKGRISIPTTGTYTFITSSDDGFVFRLKGVDGQPDPSFRQVTSPSLDPRFQMSNPNEVYYNGAGQETRCIVDLNAGQYDIEYMTVEAVGGFAYELGVAVGYWPHATNPPNGFQLVGVPASTVTIPAISDAGWKVETSLPFLTSVNNPAGSIATALDRLAFTLNNPGSSRWTELNLDPAKATTFWDKVDFEDPQSGNGGSFGPTNPFPLNTPGDDNDYAMRATGTLVITQPGTYHLGFQGDDGGYMLIRGLGGLQTPSFTNIPYTNLPDFAVIEEEIVGSGIYNKFRAETGTGNSRTLGAVDLQVGQYEIEALVFEGGGGSFWEIIGGSAAASYNYPLLTKNAASTVTLNGGLTLVAQPEIVPNDPNFAIASVSFTGNPVTSATLNIVTQAGVTYTVEASTDLAEWIVLDSAVVGAGELTPFTVDFTNFPALQNQRKVFFRAKFNN